ncbi:BREX-1 system adenine-specific DNA-methyltransferase PglX [Thalassovita autumnalis]|uniref:BREX-1 system adenine-specific DNA-methyltransferase PglX n=1 Tax=Thalassovita autumnalis TaxID=2072972 RepID=UPI00244EFD79|nr:BREX-1 system adenine-specific DNA-methyltransferase PglX [Thalassovita autumnalis]
MTPSERGHRTDTFLTSYEKLRSRLLDVAPIVSLIQIGYNTFPELNSKVAQGAAFVTCKRPETAPGYYFNLNKAPQSADKSLVYLEQLKDRPKYCFRASVKDLEKVPGMPIAYWLSDNVRAAFNGVDLSGYSKPLIGMRTGDNGRFLRNWHEVSADATSITEPEEPKWFPYAKGGEFRRWYGNNEFFVNWKDNGFELKSATLEVYPQLDWDNLGWKISNESEYFQESITWTCVSTSKFAARYIPVGSLFDTGGSFIPFRKGVKNSELLGYLNSTVAQDFLYLLNPTINYGNGTVGRLPWLEASHNPQIARRLVEIARADWDAYETSWDFTTLPLLSPDHRGETLADSYATLRAHWQAMTDKMKALEEENNRIFIDAYGLQDELTPEVPIEEITLTCNPAYRYGVKGTEQDRETRLRADTMAEFLSYAVGCMFGRYSLDAPGLILANQGERLEDYLARIPEPRFMPDADNVIPVLDENWFPDDITDRFRLFLRTTFGETHFQENLRYIEDALGKDIRKYFTKDFYADHVKRYKKRPIYWMFSSPKGTFNALIYMHRYRGDTVSVLLNDYLREFISKLEGERGRLEKLSDDPSASQGQRTKALKDMAVIAKQIDELNEWERDVVFPLAQAKIEIDLDDGVKANYPKFGEALKKIPGLEAKDD